MAEREILTIREAAFEVGVCPAVGGCIVRFRQDGVDLMRPAGPEVVGEGDVRGASCFPLVPFSNRLGDARFQFQGQTYQLEPNFPPEPHAIHGQGWQLPWSVVHANDSDLELALAHRVPETPFDYEARLTFTLGSRGLTVGLNLTATGAGPMPAGIGLHPFFVRTPGATLKAHLEHVWLSDSRRLPRERVDIPEGWTFRPPRQVDPLTLDHCFDGFTGRASIVWPELAKRMEIKADPVFTHAVIFVPPGETFFCVEPVSNANDGFNLAERGVRGTGVRVLNPGESLSGKVTFEVA